MYKMQASNGNDGLDPVRRKRPIRLHKWADLYVGRKRSMETYLRIDLVEIIEYASIRKTIHRGYTLTKWIRAN